TLLTRDVAKRSLPITVVEAMPRQSVAEQDAEYGAKLHDRDPNLCCFLRKVDPLARSLDGRAAWVTGVRRIEAPTRANTPIVSWDDKHDLVKVNPLVAWSDEDVEAYQAKYDLPRNPLVAQGYPSIGCAPCTRKVAPGEDPRAGRWSGRTRPNAGSTLERDHREHDQGEHDHRAHRDRPDPDHRAGREPADPGPPGHPGVRVDPHLPRGRRG